MLDQFFKSNSRAHGCVLGSKCLVLLPPKRILALRTHPGCSTIPPEPPAKQPPSGTFPARCRRYGTKILIFPRNFQTKLSKAGGIGGVRTLTSGIPCDGIWNFDVLRKKKSATSSMKPGHAPIPAHAVRGVPGGRNRLETFNLIIINRFPAPLCPLGVRNHYWSLLQNIPEFSITVLKNDFKNA